MKVTTSPEETLARMREVKWTWAKSDSAAVYELEWRMTKKAREKAFLNYSELVDGVFFRIPTINGGLPYRIDVRDWKDIDRALVGEFLGFISMRSFEKHGFMFSAIVIGKDSNQPSPHFFDWVKKLGLLEDTSQDGALSYWAKEFKAVFRQHARK
jgi:hypothetical protein